MCVSSVDTDAIDIRRDSCTVQVLVHDRLRLREADVSVPGTILEPGLLDPRPHVLEETLELLDVL